MSAVRAQDHARLKQILGPGGEDVISPGDPIADRETAERFLASYEEKHRWASNAVRGTAYIGRQEKAKRPAHSVR